MFREDNWLQHLVGENALEIGLRYKGFIPPDKPNGDQRSALKQEIRRSFSAQLKKRWRTSPKLLQWKSEGTFLCNKKERGRYAPDADQALPFFHVPMCGFRAIPLVSWLNNLGCELDIVFTGEGRSAITPDGDLDNRLKTLFDALRMPLTEREVPAPMWGSGDDELFCLLEDDSLIRKFSVLAVEDCGSPVEHDVRLTAKVVTLDDYPAYANF